MSSVVKEHISYRCRNSIKDGINRAIERCLVRGALRRRPNGELEITTKGLREAAEWESFTESWCMHL